MVLVLVVLNSGQKLIICANSGGNIVSNLWFGEFCQLCGLICKYCQGLQSHLRKYTFTIPFFTPIVYRRWLTLFFE